MTASFFLFSFFSFFKSFSLVSLVVPLLPKASIDFGFLGAVEESSADRFNSSDESWKSINCGAAINFLVFLRSIIKDSRFGFSDRGLLVSWEKNETVNIFQKPSFISIE